MKEVGRLSEGSVASDNAAAVGGPRGSSHRVPGADFPPFVALISASVAGTVGCQSPLACLPSSTSLMPPAAAGHPLIIESRVQARRDEQERISRSRARRRDGRTPS